MASYQAWEHKSRHTLDDYVGDVQQRESERRAAGLDTEGGDQRANIYQLNFRTTGEKKEQIEARLAGIERLKTPIPEKQQRLFPD